MVDRLAAMNAFVTVADLRRFGAAAKRLRLSPPAVTRLVAGLEEEVGIRLLHRTTRSVSLTDAGARYLERVRRILADVTEADRVARAERTEPTGRLVVAAPTSFGRSEVAPLVCDFLAKHPAVTCELKLADAVVSFGEEGIDVAVRIGHLEDSSLTARVAGATRRVLVGSPTYLAERGRPRTPADLAKHALVQLTALTPARERRFWKGGAVHPIAIEPKLVTNSPDAAVEHAARGGGLALVFAYHVAALVRRGSLEVVLDAWEPAPTPIQVVHAGSRLHAAAVRAFVELALTRKWSFVDL